MEKFALASACLALYFTSPAGTSIEGPIGVVDACGMTEYESVVVDYIVGELDCIEVIGRKAAEGGDEIRRYIDSAMPKFVIACTNEIARYCNVLKGTNFQLKQRNGLEFSLKSISGKKRVLVVSESGEKAGCGLLANGKEPADWHSTTLLDAASGLRYIGSNNKSCDCYGGSSDSTRVSFYANEAGAVKIWYEVVDASYCVKVKGWLYGMIKGDGLVEKESKVVSGDDGFTTHVEVRQIPIPNDKEKTSALVIFALSKGEWSSMCATIMFAFKPAMSSTDARVSNGREL